jgi:hypothetical protein
MENKPSYIVVIEKDAHVDVQDSSLRERGQNCRTSLGFFNYPGRQHMEREFYHQELFALHLTSG